MFTSFNTSFDTTNAMFALFLWLLFGFLSHMVNCDLQRMIKQSVAIRHIIGLTAFFFLFTIIDGGNKDVDVLTLFFKTTLVYVLFIFTTKSKWYFTLPVLGLLMIDQVAKKLYEDKKKLAQAERFTSSEEMTGIENLEQKARLTNQIINIVVICIIIVGMLHYMYLQKLEYGEQFSFVKFFFETNMNCKPHYPTYISKMNTKVRAS